MALIAYPQGRACLEIRIASLSTTPIIVDHKSFSL
jgi:hypothetical protein